jgi:hypothetical protein
MLCDKGVHELTLDPLGGLLERFCKFLAISFSMRYRGLQEKESTKFGREGKRCTLRRPRLAVVGMYNSAGTINSRGESVDVLGFWRSIPRGDQVHRTMEKDCLSMAGGSVDEGHVRRQ